jgi:ATP-dependent DNA helicase RecQ
MSTISRLSSMPLFFRKQDFWRGVLNPLAARLGNNAQFETLRIATATHRWGLDIQGFDFCRLTPRQHGLVDIAQGILERGIWTLPTWRIEQYLAGKVREDMEWRLSEEDQNVAGLSYSIQSASPDANFQNGLVTGRWPCEVNPDTDIVNEIWNNLEGEQPGSDAEFRFLKEVLIPALGFPLIDYLRLQPELTTLGLDRREFLNQRADFSLDTGRGLKLIIEVDGSQHDEPPQQLLDQKRDAASLEQGWKTWRVRTCRLDDTEALKVEFKGLLGNAWGLEARIATPRSPELLSCVWGATVVSRIQFLLLEALRHGVLTWDESWRIAVVEADTQIARQALEDFQDWFGRLRQLFGETKVPEITAVEMSPENNPQLIIDISAIQPHKARLNTDAPLAWSRPANFAGPITRRKFSTGILATVPPDESIVTSFVQDLLRKPSLREGQLDIISRILMRQDVVGLLPTGGGKSLTYQLCGLLLGGLTIYVSPLKSLLQDQKERFLALGIDLVQEISSALPVAAIQQADNLLATGGLRFLLIAPERFLVEHFRQQLAQFIGGSGEISQVVVDECHCVSEWGHDFRPAYLSLGRIVRERTQRYGISAPLVALTGTASSIVLADVRRELGVNEQAIVRARRMDRPEIKLTCEKLGGKQKEQRLKQIVRSFFDNEMSETDGLLIFSRFIVGPDGVMGITASVMAVAPQGTFRFFSGSEPDWKKYATFALRKKAANITANDIECARPSWTLDHQGNPLEWEEIKAKVQSDFISRLPGNYQVLISTNAFGMGIDKPSIRSVIHYVTPQSPEAYYQEVGRGGRDRKAAEAILLFSDEFPQTTDQILDPGASIDDAKQIYDEFERKHRFQGGDFIRTFYFHQNTFSGQRQEISAIIQLLENLRQLINQQAAPIFGYTSGSENKMEYGIVRLIILGVLSDYTKDYNAKQFSLTLNLDWEAIRDDPHELANYYAERYRTYVQRYLVSLKTDVAQKITAAETVLEIEQATAQTLVNFVYDQIERKRRQASRQMLELARIGAQDSGRFKEMLINYLQVSEKFTKDLESLAQGEATRTWDDLLKSVDSRDDLAELHGACQRILESYPTHSGLLAISATTRLRPTKDDLKRSEEELWAALKNAVEDSGINDAKQLGDAVVSYISDVDGTLADGLHSIFGIWLLKNGGKDEAIKRFLDKKAVRDAWLGEVLHDVNEIFSDTRVP